MLDLRTASFHRSFGGKFLVDVLLMLARQTFSWYSGGQILVGPQKFQPTILQTTSDQHTCDNIQDLHHNSGGRHYFNI